MARLAITVAVSLRKFRSTWYHTAHYAEGGSGSSNHCGPKKEALARAAIGVLPGETFTLTTNEKHEGVWTKTPAGALVRVS